MASPLQEYRATLGKKNTQVVSPLQQYRAKSGAAGGKADVKSSDGLYNLAVQNGLQGEADRVLAAQKGESNKFWSGGILMDTIDSLNALQYGVVGMLKGKSFADGVRSRSSFTDDDALGDKGIPGLVGGILLDIAFDPLTYVAPYTLLKRVPMLAKLGNGIRKFTIGEKVTKTIDMGAGVAPKVYESIEGGTKVGRFFVEKLAYSMGKDPVFLNIYERGLKNTAVTTDIISQVGKSVANIAPEVSSQILKRIDNQGRFGRVPLEELATKLSTDQLIPVAKLYNFIDNLGKEAVDLGLITEATRKANEGEYLKNAYMEFEQKTSSKLPFGWSKVGISGIKSRKPTLSDARNADRIDNPAYLLMKSAIDLTRDVENAKMFRAIDQKFGTTVAQQGFTKMGDGIKYGDLAGKYVPDHMASYLTDLVKPTTNPVEKWLVGNFKFAKVVMNPATHARNIMSNAILNYWKLGMNPLDPRTIKAQVTALKEIAEKGGRWTSEARPLGYNLDTFASNELKGILDAPEMVSAMGKARGAWSKVKSKLGDMYQGEENFAKLTAYIYQREVKKLSPEDAWKAAESATFNYAQVTPLIRKLRTSIWGMPFITFTYKATPVAIETALKHPDRIGIIGKIKQGIESQSDLEMTERERASEPPWVRDGFFIKLPGKDKYGRSKYFDLTYILPFGDLVSGGFFERGISNDTGTPEGPIQTALRKNPVSQLIMELGKNRNFYGNKIWKDSDPIEKQGRDILIHITKTYSPPPLAEQLPNGYNARSGEQEWKGIPGGIEASPENQNRTLMEEVFKNFGMKIQPISAEIQETYQEWNKKKALETLLKESDVLKSFELNYIPKDAKD